MRIRLAAAAIAAGIALAGTPAAAAPTEDFVYRPGCKPTAEHPNPVIYLSGGGVAAVERQSPANLESTQTMAALDAAGACVSALNYGIVDGMVGAGAIADSAAQLARYIDGLRTATGADKVDIVAKSAGALVTNYYAKLLGGAPNLRRVVYIAPVTHGSSFEGDVAVVSGGTQDIYVPINYPGGLAKFLADYPAAATVAKLVTAAYPAALECLAGSETIRKVSAGGITQPGIRYAVLASRNDRTNVPAGTASFIEEPGVTNVFFEDLFPTAEAVAHNTMLLRPQAREWVLAQLYGR